MRSPIFQLVFSGLALGLMAGSAAIHHLHIAGAKGRGELSDGELREMPEDSRSVIGQAGILSLGRYQAEGEERAPGADESADPTVEALEEIVERLRELKDVNQDLRGQNNQLQEQLKDTNRDLMELQFRVDTHSQEFRPLPVSSSVSILDGSISPGTTRHPLLPPKD